jgi:hypothetical protein
VDFRSSGNLPRRAVQACRTGRDLAVAQVRQRSCWAKSRGRVTEWSLSDSAISRQLITWYCPDITTATSLRNRLSAPNHQRN